MRLSAALAVAAALAPSASALALDRFEIQVYQGEHNEALHPSVELHLNYTPAGLTEPEFPGATPPDRAARATLELAFGITDWLEVGAYFQGLYSPYGGAMFGGWKARTKLVAPERWRLPLRLGLNVEVSHVPANIEEAAWAAELRPIVGVDIGRVALSLNPIVTWAISGPDAFKPELEPAFKAVVNSELGFGVGLEYYAGLGPFDVGLLPLAEQEQLLFVAFDLVPPTGTPPAQASPWELNVGVGKALTLVTGQQWLVKAIVGRAF